MPSEPHWKYDPRTHNYVRRGRFVAFSEIRMITLQAAEASGNTIESLTRRLIRGELRLDHWQAMMRDALRNEHSAQYMAGKGGRGQMTQRDWGILGNTLRNQYQFLDTFAQDIAAGGMTPAQIIARARMYMEDAHQSFWRGYTESLEMPSLPTYPCHCDTACLTKDRCQWVIIEILGKEGERLGWEATWQLDPLADKVHCDDCPKLATLWNPLWVPAGMSPREATIWRNAERKKMAALLK